MKKVHYDTSFKETIVSLLNSGKTAEELCSEYKVSLSSIQRWKKQFGSDKSKEIDLSALSEIKALKKELKEIKLERDILKKAVSIFSVSDK